MSEPNQAVFHRRTLANSALAFLAATRPAFLTASVLPVLSAGALAFAQGARFPLPLLALAALNIAFIHSGANVLNDYFDARSGTDALNEQRIFPFTGGSRFIQNGVLSERETLALGLTLSGIGALMGFAFAWQSGPLLLVLGLAGGLLGYFYSAPPCLACRGLGDLVVGVCFGILPLAGTTLILTGQIPVSSLWLGAAIGCFVAAILWANSIPDIASDRASGKMTLPVRLGAKAAALGLPLWFGGGFALLLLGPLPAGASVALAAAFPAFLAGKAAAGEDLPSALPLTIATHAAFCILCMGGLLVWPA